MITVPIYLRYLGPEAYGLIGFYTVIHTWMSLLEMGLGASLGRQASHLIAVNKIQQYSNLFLLLEKIYLGIGFTAALIVISASGYLANDWLKIDKLEISAAQNSIMIMGVLLLFRWASGMYRSSVIGTNEHVELNAINIFIYTLRYIGGLLLIIYWSKDIEDYFIYQFIIGLVEAIILRLKLISILRNKGAMKRNDSSKVELKGTLKYALGIAYTSGIWVLVSQTDKLLLSTYLPLAEFGYYTIIILFMSAVRMSVGPISQTYIPRLTTFASKGELGPLYKNYVQLSKGIVYLSGMAIVLILLNTKEIILIWTNNINAANWVVEYVFWFLIGSAFLAASAPLFFIQNAFGDLKIHTISSTIAMVVQVPLIYFSIQYKGVEGASYAWALFNFLGFIIMNIIVNRKFIKGKEFEWVRTAVCWPLMKLIIIGLVILKLNIEASMIYKILINAFLLIFLVAMSEKYFRVKIIGILRKNE